MARMPFTVMKDEMSLDMCRDVTEKLDEIRADLETVTKYVDDVKKLQRSILDDPFSDEKKKRDLEKLQASIRSTANRMRKNLKDLDARFKTDYVTASHSAAIRIQKAQYGALSKKFLDAMESYNQAEVDFRDRCKTRIQRKLDIAGMHVDEDRIDDMLSGDSSVFTQGILQDTDVARRTLSDVRDRYEDIVKLESEIAELHELMVDIALLIENQGDMVDSIEKHVDMTVVAVDSGTTDMNKAAVSAHGYRRKKLYCFIGLIVALGVIVIIIVVSVYTSKK